MISKNQIKHVSSLHLKKNRDKEELFFVEGTKMVKELLASSCHVHSIYATDEWMEKHSNLASKVREINIVTEAALNRISALATPQQVVALVTMPHHKLELNDLKGKLTLVLDDIKDPGNLGTIIRIADWFGIENIICSENSVDLYNPKVVQATMGSLFRVKVFYIEINPMLKENKVSLKLPVFAAVMESDSVYNASLDKQAFIILGNESDGVGEELMNYVDHKITIPSFASGGRAESLNVAVASAIICSEFRRRSLK